MVLKMLKPYRFKVILNYLLYLTWNSWYNQYCFSLSWHTSNTDLTLIAQRFYCFLEITNIDLTLIVCCSHLFSLNINSINHFLRFYENSRTQKRYFIRNPIIEKNSRRNVVCGSLHDFTTRGFIILYHKDLYFKVLVNIF